MILLQATIGKGMILFPIIIINYIFWIFILKWLNNKGWISRKGEAYLYLLSILATVLSLYGIYFYLESIDFIKAS